MKLQLIFMCVVTVAIIELHEVCGANILALLTLTTRSHHIWNRELMIALAKRGHNVTVLSPDADEKPVNNLTYIQIHGSYDHIRSESSYEESVYDVVLLKMNVLNGWVLTLCDFMLSTEGTKTLMNYPDGKIFDLIIIESEYTQCFWPFISKFGNPPVMAVCATGIPRRANYMTGTPKNPAYTPDYYLPLSDKLTFMQRVHSFMGEISGLGLTHFKYIPAMQEIVDRHFSFPVPPLLDYERNISLILTNTGFGYDPPQPVTPNIIPVGGVHLKPPRPLEKKLQEFLDGAKEGAIFFSLGSNIQSTLLPDHVHRMFLDAFSELPQRVVWKFESDKLQNIPRNVMVGKWLPQGDILGHKNVKLFLTHNGMLSSQEAVYSGVPTIGIPFFMDQHYNAERARVLGIGLILPYKILSKETLLARIREVLINRSYTENAQRMSSIFRDQMDHPLDRAVWWTEYVLRHKGAPHLRTAAVDMPMYQYLLLDVLGLVLLLVGGALLLLVYIVRSLWRRLAAPTTKAKTQ